MLSTVEGRVGEPVHFEGFAEDHDKRIVAIEFSLDDGHTWTSNPVCATSDRLVHWTFAYTPPTTGTYCLLVRSVNERGKRSPTPAERTFVVR